MTTPADSLPCPPYAPDRDGVVCSHTVDPEAASVYLDATPPTSPLVDGEPAETVTLALSNQSSIELRFNPYSWRVWRRSDGEWTALQRRQSGDGVVTVPSDETHSWSFWEAVGSIQPEPDLRPRLHAATIEVPDPEGEDWIACVALVSLRQSESGLDPAFRD